MKYEDFNHAAEIVAAIDKRHEIIQQLSAPTIRLCIYGNTNTAPIMTIGADANYYEHDYARLAENFVSDIKKDLENQIEKLTKHLAEL